MTAPALSLTITTAGLERFTAAQLDGDVDLTISEIGFTDDEFVASPTLTALPGEFRRIDTLSGDTVGDNIVHLVVRDEAAMTYSVRGFGLFLADGTLFAVYGQPQIIVEKSLLSTVLIAIDIAFPTADINALTFGNTDFLNPPATTATRGVVELATEAEALEGEDVTRAITPAGLAAAIEAALYANDKIGTVKMWWGAPADIAIGWAICNGQTVARSDGAGNVTTPDLRDRVPVGVSGTHALGSAFGATSKTVNTTADGAHTPSGTLPAHNHGVSLTGSAQTSLTGAYVSAPLRGDVAGGGSGQAVNTAGLVDPGHDHDVTLTGGTDNAADLALSIEAVPPHQHGATMDVTQPSLALHFIMRV